MGLIKKDTKVAGYGLLCTHPSWDKRGRGSYLIEIVWKQ
jgi:hypothetical protein